MAVATPIGSSKRRAALRFLPVHNVAGGKCSCGKADCEKNAGKHPRIDGWQQSATTDERTIQRWRAQWPGTNVGVATGTESGVVVLDVDPRNGGDATLAALEAEHGALPATPTVLTGGGGLHYYFAYPTDGEPVPNSISGIGLGLDVQSDGKLVVAPPSIHRSGRAYEWKLEDVALAAIPDWLLILMRSAPGSSEFEPDADIPDGARNGRLYLTGRKLHRAGLNQDEILAHLRRVNNEQCKPPLRERELAVIARNCATQADRKSHQRGKVPLAEQLIDLVREQAELFHDGDKAAYAAVEFDDHREVWRLSDHKFKIWLAGAHYARTSQAANRDAIATALTALDGIACYKGPEHELDLRVAGRNGKIYLDLANDLWQAVEVDADGWRIVTPTERGVYFYRPSGLRALPMPTPQSDASALTAMMNFLNIDADVGPLVIAWLVAALQPHGPYPVLACSGEAGAAKSSTMRYLRALIDPNKSVTRAEPHEMKDLQIAAQHSWVLSYDNLKHLQPWLSNGFCRLATGGGVAARQLYTDADEVILDAMRPAIINGINELTTYTDLLDRSIVAELLYIPDDKRRPESELEPEFEALRPAVLGALLNATSRALKNLAIVNIDRLPRMADFAKWIVAAESALPWKTGEFMRLYRKNIADSNSIAAEASPIYELLLKAIPHDDTATALLGRMRDLGGFQPLPRGFPTTAQGLTAALKRIAGNLRKMGINIEHGRASGERVLKITSKDGPNGTLFK